MKLFLGTKFSFDYKHDGVIEYMNEFILAECLDSDYLFQIICIKGYHKGCVEGYIRYQTSFKYITVKHLRTELKSNFIKINWRTFKLFK